MCDCILELGGGQRGGGGAEELEALDHVGEGTWGDAVRLGHRGEVEAPIRGVRGCGVCEGKKGLGWVEGGAGSLEKKGGKGDPRCWGRLWGGGVGGDLWSQGGKEAWEPGEEGGEE